MSTNRWVFAFDTETFLIVPGELIPRLVSFAYKQRGNYMLGDEAKLFHAKFHRFNIVQLYEMALDAAIAGECRLVAHNGAYDHAVMGRYEPRLLPKIFQAYENDGISCSKIQEMMIDLYHGQLRIEEDEETGHRSVKGYSLDDVSQRRLDRKLDKGDDGWRLRYSELYDVPLDQWPERAYAYAIDDADVELQVDTLQWQDADAISAYHENEGHVFADATTQAADDFALFLMCAKGMITGAQYVAELERRLRGLQATAREKLLSIGVLRAETYKRSGAPKLGPDGQPKFTLLQDKTAELVEGTLEANGLPVHLTETGKVSTKAEYFRRLTTDRKDAGLEPEAGLMALQDYKGAQKLTGTYLPKLWRATRTPLQPRFNVLLDTGRTSATDNMQTPPREHGIRQCFVPPPGFLLCSVDYSVAELRSLAQCCLWLGLDSKMATLFQKDIKADPHGFFACDMSRGELVLEIFKVAAKDKSHPLHKLAKKLRKDAKAANFGFPGGMGPRKFVETNARVGNYYTEHEASVLRNNWLDTWTEMEGYFEIHASLLGARESVRIQQFRSGRYRGGCSYTEACNTRFQGLTADIAKRALFRVQWECYLGTHYDRRPGRSPLAGSFVVNFLHDEILAAISEHRAHEAAHRIRDIMVATADEYMTDVPSYAEPAMARRWFKEMEPVYVNGQLVPWEPTEIKQAA